jgi:hypothetical protein
VTKMAEMQNCSGCEQGASFESSANRRSNDPNPFADLDNAIGNWVSGNGRAVWGEHIVLTTSRSDYPDSKELN